MSAITADNLRAPFRPRIVPLCTDLASLPRMPSWDTACYVPNPFRPVIHNFPIVSAEKKCAPYHRLLRAPQRSRVRDEPMRSKKLIKLESLLLAAATSDNDE
ncbi:hypothetical protein BOTBODRAFT_170797 [Botryobasidium botryosum FD-172 SS1]|uniref:Uncharacterized protein n=1 Tax=Botryobasidium botryosum (strain FD-172 SS1) TaxID=930990 RepID=A0A067MVS2_BOTB1|nr:hypothetical protein BOTBODRAFT_170797 [Botryobasidium botryosum FD-172 SS1]